MLSGLLLALDTSVVAAIPSGNGTVVKVQSQQVNSPNTPPSPPPKKKKKEKKDDDGVAQNESVDSEGARIRMDVKVV